jgi:hypothetical protein
MEIKRTQHDVRMGTAGELKPAKESQESPATDRDYSKLLKQERDVDVEAWVRAKKNVRIEDPEKAKNFQALMMKYYGQPPSEAEEKRILEEIPGLERHRTMVFSVPQGDRTPAAPSKVTINKAEQIDQMAAERLKAELVAVKGRKALLGRAKPATENQAALSDSLFVKEAPRSKGSRKASE